MKSDASITAHLSALAGELAEGLPGVSRRRMFGCDAFFHDGSIFGLIWKTGRIGLKLTDEDDHKTLMAMKGSAPWAIGGKTMGAWVLVPESFHDDPETLSAWVRRAHAQAAPLPNGPKVKARVAKKAAAKARPARAPRRTAK